MEHKNDDAQSGGSRNHFLPAGRRFGRGRAGLIFLSLFVGSSRERQIVIKLRGLIIGSLALSTPLALALDYPTKPIRMVVPFASGGATDILARTVSVKMIESWRQQVIVDNRPGAGGNIGTDLVAKATPNGYTLVLGAASVLAINASLYAKMPYDTATAFAPITQMSSNANVLIVNPSLPAKSVNELIAYAKVNPDKLTFVSGGAGGTIHLSGELFKAMAGIDMVHVAYKSSALAHIDLISGRVQIMFDNMPTALPQIKAGKLRALAVTAAKRSSLLPDLPTVAEAGLPGYEAVGWFGFAAPAGTPKEIVRQLNREIVRILRLPDVEERLAAQGAEVVGNSPEEFARFIKAEMAKWGKIIKTLNIRLD